METVKKHFFFDKLHIFSSSKRFLVGFEHPSQVALKDKEVAIQGCSLKQSTQDEAI